MAELREWLEARGLGRYADALLAQDIELDILPQLTDADLTAAGLPVGARKRLLEANIEVLGIRSVYPSLEDIFVSFTRKMDQGALTE